MSHRFTDLGIPPRSTWANPSTRPNPGAADIVKAELAKPGEKPLFDINRMRQMEEDTLRTINEQMQATRVFCATTNKNDEKMWAEYAENHKGITLRIEPNLAKHSKFRLFRPVIYRETRPSLFDSAEDL